MVFVHIRFFPSLLLHKGLFYCRRSSMSWMVRRMVKKTGHNEPLLVINWPVTEFRARTRAFSDWPVTVVATC